MNFLAHLHLSGSSEQLMIGNFIGDFVKGRNFDQFNKEVALGIQLHRTIDSYTDTHPVVHQSKNRIRKKYKLYSGVIIDMFYDHFLAINWEKYTTTPLDTFAKNCYATVDNNLDTLPEGIKYMFPYMKQNDWLVSYLKIDGIQRALNGITRRTSYASKMNEATHELRLYYDEFNEDFLAFYPDLIRHTTEWKAEHCLVD